MIAPLLALYFYMVAGLAPAAEVPRISFEDYVLPNGVQVILHRDQRLPLVHVNLWYHVGSKNEKPGRTGFAHLFEHMMLQGSKNASVDFFTLMQRAGARPGRDSNGTTNNDRTNYFSTAPSGSLEFLLWVHSDLLATLPDALTQAKLDNQRDVVRNERRLQLDNQPYGRWYMLLGENLFPAGHPYSWPVIGSHEDLQAATLEDVKEFFRTFYTPNNLSLVIAGDFDPVETRRLVEKYFGSIPPGPALERPRRWIPVLEGRRVVDVSDRVPQDRVFLGWPAPEIGAPDETALTLAASILADGLSARLQKALVYQSQLASEVHAFNDSREIAGAFVVDATARPGESLDEIEQVIDSEILRLAKDGPGAAELERARTKNLTEFTVNLERMGAFGGRADVLNYYSTYFGDPARLDEDLQRVLRATTSSIRDATARWLATDRRVVLRFHPETSIRPAVTEPDRRVEPRLSADSPFQPPSVSSERLENGLEILVVERHDLPVVTATLVTRAGSLLDPPGKEGLARLTASAMVRGTKAKNALAVADALGDLGTALSTIVGIENVRQSLEVQKGNLGRALALLSEIVRTPTYPDLEVERERKLQLDELEQVEKDPGALAARLRPMAAFGPSHPYSRPTIGFRRTIAPLSAAEVSAFHREHWRPDASALILVGDVTIAEARAIAEREMGDWSGTATPVPPVPPPAPMAKGKVLIVDRPDAAQTYIVHVYGAPARKGPDFYGWTLANEVLGGGTAGRLNMNLRQDKGYSYGMFTARLLFADGLAWLAQGAVQTDKTKEAMAEMIAELEGIAGARPIGSEELENARLGLIRNYAAGFGTNEDIANRVATLWTLRWPMSELEREPAELAGESLANVQAAARRYAIPAEATFILIGDRAKIEPGVSSLGLGEPVEIDADGSVIR
ncbi:MAG: M16 family metallopeptidase [Candidatus Eisenbacteria bacterium]